MYTPEWFHLEHQDKEIEGKAIAVGYDVALEKIRVLENGIRSGWGERQVQAHLKGNRYILLGRYRTGHCTYAFYEEELGSEYRIDWAVANGSSGGMSWELIELESPKAVPFIGDGNFSEATRRGLNQIRDWRDWLQRNIDYANREVRKHGLGLLEIEGASALLVVGRRSTYDSADGLRKYDDRRKRERLEARVEIISYESFVESLRFRFSR